jgi:FkbM family methyltransferase
VVITPAGFAVLEYNRDLVLSRWVERDGSLDGYDPRIRQVLAPMVPKGGCVIDCGAFLGSHTTVYAESVGLTGHVVAFEPSPLHFACLQHNTRLLPQVSALQNALYNEEATLWFAPNFFNAGASVVGDPNDLGAFEVQAVALDSFYWDRVDFIKIDVEGLVLRVLEGAERLLRTHRPVVVTEVGDNLQLFGDTTEDVISFMRRQGYTYAELPTMHGEDTTHQQDLLFRPVEGV